MRDIKIILSKIVCFCSAHIADIITKAQSRKIDFKALPLADIISFSFAGGYPGKIWGNGSIEIS